jgi:hypothetical protein
MHESFDPTVVNDVPPPAATGVEQDTKSGGKTEQRSRYDRQEILARHKEELSDIYHRYKDRALRMADDAIRAGNILIEVKKIVGHGKFGWWIKNNCPFKERSAQYYMRIAEAGVKPATVALYGIRDAAEGVQNGIAKRKMRLAGVTEREIEKKRARRRQPKRFRNKVSWKQLPGTGLKIPFLKADEVFRVAWTEKDPEAECEAYVWLDDSFVETFHWIFLRYVTNDSAVVGEHEASDRAEKRYDVQSRLLNRVQKGWPRETPVDLENERWDADPAFVQLLGGWRKTIRIADEQIARSPAGELIREARRANLMSAIAEPRAARITKLEAELAARDREIATRDSQIATKDRAITRLRELLRKATVDQTATKDQKAPPLLLAGTMKRSLPRLRI